MIPIDNLFPKSLDFRAELKSKESNSTSKSLILGHCWWKDGLEKERKLAFIKETQIAHYCIEMSSYNPKSQNCLKNDTCRDTIIYY